VLLSKNYSSGFADAGIFVPKRGHSKPSGTGISWHEGKRLHRDGPIRNLFVFKSTSENFPGILARIWLSFFRVGSRDSGNSAEQNKDQQ
jgi:hypothetical protein